MTATSATGATSSASTTGTAAPAGLEWPASPWGASAPESYLLLNFQRRPEGKEALKLGILELLARHRLRLVEVERKGFLGRRALASSLIWGTPPEGKPFSLGAALAPLWDVYQELRPRREPLWGAGPEGEQVDGVDVKDFAQAVVKRFGSVDGYLQQAVRPALQERGWVAPQKYRILGIFPATRWVLTPEGSAAQGDLLWRVQYGNRELGRLVDDDPSRAILFAGLAGAAVLLMDDARPHLLRLREQLAAGAQAQTQAQSGAATTTDAGSGSSESSGSGAETGGAAVDGVAPVAGGPDPGVLDSGALDAVHAGFLDPGAIDLGAMGLDLGALDAVDAAVSAVDAGVDAGAGGDGGSGGDGGGGGGGGE